MGEIIDPAKVWKGGTREDRYDDTASGYLLKTIGYQTDGAGAPIVSVVINDEEPDAKVFPSALIGFGYNESPGSQSFGLFSRGIQYAERGVATNEINSFNESDTDATSTVNPDRGFGTHEQLPIGLTVAHGRDRKGGGDGSIGIQITSEGGSSVGYKTGLLIDPSGCKDRGLVVRGHNTRHAVLIDTRESEWTGPTLYLDRDNSTARGGDDIGRVLYLGRNDDQDEVGYVDTRARIVSSQSGRETAQYSVLMQTGGILREHMRLDADKSDPLYVTLGGRPRQVGLSCDTDAEGNRLLVAR